MDVADLTKSAVVHTLLLPLTNDSTVGAWLEIERRNKLFPCFCFKNEFVLNRVSIN